MSRADEHPKKRSVYGVPHGSFRGEMFCYIESSNDNHYFLSLPQMIIRVVPKEKFEFAIKNTIIEFIEELPKKVYKVIEAQYKQCRTMTYGKFNN